MAFRMRRWAFVVPGIFGFFVFTSCQKDFGVESFNYGRDTPQWLKTKIDTMAMQPYYVGTSVYRHEWRGMYFYHIEIPLSSCVYCEVYDQGGNKVHFESQDEFEDYRLNRKNEVLVWRRDFNP